ncbi:Reticulon [Dillenia turbinata]|uniref:Reticulon-like protein n=1 Tax=Dillenia turbinata TaxID=194707 RepID=A0AAN8W0Y1_9MAGN
MEVGKRSTSRSGVVAAGSVWESRMKIDEFKGGIKVFNGEETSNNSEQVDAAVDNGKELKVYRRLNKNSTVGNGKRKTWKSESNENPIKLIKDKSENLRSPIQIRKTRSESVDGIEKNPVQIRKTKSESVDLQGKKIRVDAIKDLGVSVDGIERDPIQIGKGKAQLDKEIGDSIDRDEKLTSSSAIELKKAKSEPKRVFDESAKKIDAEIEESEIPNGKTISNDVCKEFGICQENVGRGESAPELVADEEVDEEEDDDFDEEDEDFEGEREEATKKENCEEIDVEVDVEKEINIEEQETKQVLNEEKNIDQFQVNEKTITISTKIHQFNEKPIAMSPKLDQIQEKQQQPIPISSKLTQIYQNHLSDSSKLHQVNEKPIPIPNSSKFNQALAKPIAILNSPKKLNQIQDKPTPTSALLRKKQPSPAPVTPIRKPSVVFPDQTKTTPSEFQRISETANKFQNLVDLVMWRDVSKSALVFGVGTFFMISSSYTKDLNVSFISVTSYLGLFYLAAIFLYKTILRRGVVDMDDSDQDYMVGEEEAIWLLKLVLPYLNEFLMKLKGLFSGDPATTMKLAVLLFVMARCGSSITLWKMVKLGFFGVFTVPKVCSSYSTQLTGYGKFWIQRFRDAWESCSHKKAVAFAIFTLVWNLSSVVARIWAVFMLFVAVRYYQQSMVKDEDWVEEEEEESEDLSSQRQERRQRQGQGPTIVEIVKEKKGS